MIADRDLDDRYGWVVNTSLIGSSLVLAVGLIVHTVLSHEALAQRILRLGLILLMATPALRIVIAIAERGRRRDVPFVIVTLIVVLELGLTLWYAATRV